MPWREFKGLINNQMQRRLTGLGRTTTGFAIQGHHLRGERGQHRLDPAPECGLECLRLDQREEPGEGIMRRNAVGQRQVATKPRQLLLSPCLDLFEGTGADQNAADGDGQGFGQEVLNLVGLPRIGQGDEYVHDGGCRPGHSSAPQIPKLYRLALSSANASHSLHAIALAIADTFDYVDYFPSYEIIMNSERSKTVMDDGIHICAEPVENVIRQFKAAYLACPFASTPSSLVKARKLVFQKECVL